MQDKSEKGKYKGQLLRNNKEQFFRSPLHPHSESTQFNEPNKINNPSFKYDPAFKFPKLDSSDYDKGKMKTDLLTFDDMQSDDKLYCLQVDIDNQTGLVTRYYK